MNKPTKHFSAFFAALLFAAALVRAAAIKEDADVFSGHEKKIGQLHAGAVVTVLEESGEWIKIRYETADASFEGHVKASLVDQNAAGTATAGPAADPAPADTPPVAHTNAPAYSGPELALNSHWQIQSKSGSTLAADFATLLKDVAKPRINLTAPPRLVLYNDLYYLMPVADALKFFNQTILSSEPVNTPGFPSDSFKAYGFDLKLDGVTHCTLVADMKNQLVAVQMSDTTQKGEPVLSHRFEDAANSIAYTDSFKLYDIVKGRTKGASNWHVGAIMEVQSGGVLFIETELITGPSRPDAEKTDGAKSKERVRLYLPQTVADLCAYLLQARK